MNFIWPVRVYYEDTDSGGVVYYANYLKFMERARTEYLRHLGYEQDTLIKNENMVFAVRAINLDYHKPARFNEQLEVSARVIECKKASMLFEQMITRKEDGQLLCSGKVRIASLKADSFKPCPLPKTIREIVSVD
ncbi:MAG: tol-pal system-associated acyl-CoA thioesterase [Gammaproteobacteria bacterium]|nr:tol-pal system-associated acyl-CoA thioesterase [Gammaproteobacteria bacterium]MCW8910392.1 tol-pal system-associated acyl-CoA thioesterase [Gammaproteobacteria bacterium]MCW9004620.1 tol-pal system-associated acyl-CoA thioesterase [Gammaproteobacteria bacterium]MCW9056671.1 tol-pal system-associated acyl-CoA thioesterase [Gammaproteobacteria bacterium]